MQGGLFALPCVWCVGWGWCVQFVEFFFWLVGTQRKKKTRRYAKFVRHNTQMPRGKQHGQDRPRQTKARRRRGHAAKHRSGDLDGCTGKCWQQPAHDGGERGRNASLAWAVICFPSLLRTNNKGTRAHTPKQCIGTCAQQPWPVPGCCHAVTSASRFTCLAKFRVLQWLDRSILSTLTQVSSR